MTITRCRLCGTELPDQPAITLNNVPQQVQYFPATPEELAADKGATLTVFECTGCGLVQLNTPPVVYAAHGITSTSAYSDVMMNYRRQQMQAFVEEHNLKGANIVDVGCGDGFLLGILSELDINAVGIDAAEEAIESARNKGLNAHVGYFGKDSVVTGAPFDAFISTDVLEHIPDLKDFLQGIAANLVDGGIGLIETHNVNNLLAKHRFYDFVLDHLSYFTDDTFRLSLELSGFDVLHVEVNRNDENLTAIVRKRPTNRLQSLNEHTSQLQSSLRNFLNDHHANSQRVAVWGASFQTLTIFATLDLEHIEYVIDSAPYKQHKYTPASHLPIVPPAHLKDDPVDVILVIAARYKDEILAQIRDKEAFTGQVAVLEGVNIEVVG